MRRAGCSPSCSADMEANATRAQRLGWYVRRLRSMEKGELPWRVGQALLRSRFGGIRAGANLHPDIICDWTEALSRFRSASDRPVLLDRQHAEAIAEREPKLVSELIDAADRSAEYRFRFFGYPTISLKQPVDWHHDPFADVRWPDSPSHRIDHRTAAGDVKWIWELNRLQHLPWLAQAWLFTGDDRYSRAAFSHLDSWLEQNPAGRGIAWRGAFEAGLRAVSICVALQGLRDSPDLTIERYRRIVTMLAQSQLLCWRERSLFSSANNHLIGEMVGLAVTSMMFPELRSAAQGERRAMTTLALEARKQILPDGAGAEQSVGYQLAAVELLHLVAALSIQRDGDAPRPITDAIARSTAYLSAVVGQHDPEPRYGDCDQEFALRLGPEDARDVRGHLGLVATLGGGGAGAHCGPNSLGAEWFRAVAQSNSPRTSTSDSARRAGNEHQSFVAGEGGLVVLRNGGRRTTMDTGPLGYLSIAAHGHADALAVSLSDNGEDLVGDPGTGSYYRHPQWRAVMRGTRAHATVCVDGEDQSVIGGPFLWTRHAHTRLRGVNLSSGVVDAEHDGYTRLPGRVMHRRWLIAPPADRAQLVVDFVSGTGVHEVRTSWPLHPSLDASRFDAGHTLSRDQVPVLQVMHAATVELRFDDSFGDEANALGWWSDRLESRVPAWWLGAVCRVDLPVVIATLIIPADGVQTSDFGVTMQHSVIEATWTEDTVDRSVVVRVDGSADVTHCGSSARGNE